jgi:hypothetical protein
MTLDLGAGAGARDLGARALVAAVVSPPRFGREGELLATATAAGAAGADLLDVSLEPRLIGSAVREAGRPVAARVTTAESGEAARSAGTALLFVGVDLVAQAVAEGWPVALVVDDVGEIGAARAEADRHGVPLAIDTARQTAYDALAQEAVAIASGCRVLRTADVRRSRRVVEVLAALLDARRQPDLRPGQDGAEVS